MREKMIYMSHVDWKWIKQRPHFLAEGLSEHFDVSVMYMFQNRKRKDLQKREISKRDVTPLFTIPMANRIKIVGALNRIFTRVQFTWKVKRTNPKVIYLTYPTQIDFIPQSYSGIVVYDCMDDHVAMISDDRKTATFTGENTLLKRADIVLVSSINLQGVLLARYGQDYVTKMYLVRNGYSGDILDVAPKMNINKEVFTISYIGTVGKWFNFDFVLKSLEDIPGLRYRIIGPCDVTPPHHDRIEYMGTIEHHKLYDAVKDTDCLVMPFVLNDIVASVDPVKLYEYINYNMNILCVRYPEIERFEPFVHFYGDYKEYRDKIRSMMEDNTIKYTDDVRRKFLMENNWEHRVEKIISILQG